MNVFAKVFLINELLKVKTPSKPVKSCCWALGTGCKLYISKFIDNFAI